MPEYILAYHVGDMPKDPEVQKKMGMEWQAWMAEQGDALVNPQTPLGKSKTVSADGVEEGGGPNPLLGFSILEADDMDAALEVAKSCPYLKIGTIELAELKKM